MSPHDPARCERYAPCPICNPEGKQRVLWDIQRLEDQGAVVMGMLQRRIAELERPRPWWDRLLERLGL